MDGTIALSLEREPSFALAQEIEGDRHSTVVVRDGDTGAIVGMGSRSVREVWVDGRPQRVGYLGALRAAAGRRGLVRLAAGYRGIAATHRPDELPFDVTSIVADNLPARRMLERGLPGLPRYVPLCDYRTLLIATRAARTRASDRDVSRATPQDLPEIAACLERNLARYQLAPVWSAAALSCTTRCRGLRAEDFAVIHERGRIVACAAVWDQRTFKQAVVRGYAPWMARARPALNVLLGLARRPRLPAVGSVLPLAFLSHLAVDADSHELAARLIDVLRHREDRRGIELLALGLAASHPLFSVATRRAGRSYASCLYRVEWPGSGAHALEPGPVHLEIATL